MSIQLTRVAVWFVVQRCEETVVLEGTTGHKVKGKQHLMRCIMLTAMNRSHVTPLQMWAVVACTQ